MVSRSNGWRIVTLAAAFFAAASAMPTPPLAQDHAAGGLVWGGHVPPPPRAGEAPVYVPSPAYGSDAQTMAPAAFQGVQPTPPQFLPPPVEPSPIAESLGVPLPPLGLPSEGVATDTGRTYPVQEAPSAGSALPPPAPVQQAALPPLGEPQIIDDGGPAGLYGSRPEDSFDPWEGLTEASEADATSPEAPAPPAVLAPDVPSYAALEQQPVPEARGRSWNPFRWGRGSLESRTPPGYRALPRQEAACRRELQRLGVRFTDAGSVGNGGSCGIQNAVRVTEAARGIAMSPAATLSCQTALQTARWLNEEVRPAARWTLWKRPAAVLNASSYRCSRIAGSRTMSEHALGNALDIRGFRFADGSTFAIEPKGFFSPRERSFQNKVRQAGCRYFGTVLGPGYNRAHDDHLHFDVKSRMRPVCK